MKGGRGRTAIAKAMNSNDTTMLGSPPFDRGIHRDEAVEVDNVIVSGELELDMTGRKQR